MVTLESVSDEIVADRVRAMADRIAHRGPDDSGVRIFHADGATAGLGHRRLSIIDVSPAGHQPMQSPSGRDIWITFNGEVYNFLELRPELEDRGFRFRSGTDTECVLAAYEIWGPACVDRLGGMFAFAIWDGEKGELFCARDRLGKKPLLYWHDGRQFAFASELGALAALEQMPRAFSEQGLAAYFSLGFVPGDLSILNSVRKLPPASRLTLRGGRARIDRYWNPIDAARRVVRSDRTDQELTDELDGLLRRATRRRLISDVPLGAWLSGGIDSSLVVAAMCEAGQGRVRTFTIGFGESVRDESKMARQVAQHLGTEHEELQITPAEMLAEAPVAAGVYDEPFADEAGLPTYVVSKLSRRHVTVALCGDGGDEGFLGYRHHLNGSTLGAVDRLPGWLRKAASSVGGAFGSVTGSRWRQRIRSLAYADWAELYVRMTSTLRPDAAGRVVAAQFVLDGTVYRDIGRQLEGFPAAMKLGLFDLTTTLPDKFLVKVDRASMRVALEVRAPLLDHELVEWGLSLPQRFKLRSGVGKWILRELLYRKVPRELVDRPKMGFCPPVDQWMRAELADWVRDTLSPRRIREVGVLDPAAVSRIVDLHLSSRAELGPALWTLMCFMTWHQKLGRAVMQTSSRAGAA